VFVCFSSMLIELVTVSYTHLISLPVYLGDPSVKMWIGKCLSILDNSIPELRLKWGLALEAAVPALLGRTDIVL